MPGWTLRRIRDRELVVIGEKPEWQWGCGAREVGNCGGEVALSPVWGVREGGRESCELTAVRSPNCEPDDWAEESHRTSHRAVGD